MTIRAAKIENSPRLLRFLGCLASGQWRSTMQIIQEAQICAVSACASECRAQGQAIETKCEGKVWFYRLPNRNDGQQELAL